MPGVGVSPCISNGIDDFVETESETDQGKSGSDPRQGCAFCCGSIARFGQFRIGIAPPVRWAGILSLK